MFQCLELRQQHHNIQTAASPNLPAPNSMHAIGIAVCIERVRFILHCRDFIAATMIIDLRFSTSK